MIRNWRTESRYYQTMLTQNLFGEWVLIRAWGSRFSRQGQQKETVVTDFNAGVKEVEAIAKVRAKRGYTESNSN